MFRKNLKFFLKKEKRSIKMLKTVQLPPSSYLTTYYQSLDEVSWLLRQEKLNIRQMFGKNLEIANFIKKFLKFEKLNCW